MYIDNVVVTSVRPSIVASIDVAPASATIAIGTTRTLVATARDAAGNPVDGISFSWSSSNENVATVSADGVVGAVTPGTATITASADGKSGTAAITVVPAGAGPERVVLDEGFEAGSFATWDDGYDPARHRIVNDAAGAHSGSKYLTITYPAGGDGGWLTKFFMPGFDSVHVSYWVRLPSTWSGGTYLLGLYGSPIDNQWGAFGKAGVCPTGSDYFASFLVAQSSGSPGPTRFSTYYPGMPKSGWQCWGHNGVGSRVDTSRRSPASRPLAAGGVLVRLNTPGQSNGSQRMWIDRVLRGEWTGLRFRDTQT